MIILIPSYEPTENLINLIKKLNLLCDFPIIVVDDGSDVSYHPLFQRAKDLGVILLSHSINLGKGEALKTGFDYILKHRWKDGLVCADSDGQHLPEDIIRIGNAISNHPHQIILGSRRFTGNVPIRSQFGNTLTRGIFKLITGLNVFDTQTGLRGFSNDMIPWLTTIEGSRFEYEMHMLLEAKKEGIDIFELDIETIYLEQNHSTHFRALTDSFLVYLPILKFGFSSFACAIVDFCLLLFFQFATSNLLLSVIGARIISSLLNYVINQSFVFPQDKENHFKSSFIKYYSLVLIILGLNYSLIHILYITLGIPLVIAKISTEIILFALSYFSQKKIVFSSKRA